MMDPFVQKWWYFMSAIALFNMLLLLFAYRKHRLRKASEQLKRIRQYHVFLAAVYTLGCGFRSVLPRADLRRVVLVDSWISAIFIGRTVATIAELSFVLQWSFLLYELGLFSQNKTVLKLSKWPFPIIFIAELFSWYACTTSNYMGTIIEESLWAIAAAITVYGLWISSVHYIKEQLKFLYMAIVAGLMYVLYMLMVDVPAYVNKWMADEKTGKVYKSVQDGLIETTQQWTVGLTYQDWQYEMIWMTLYFSVAVWMSIYLIVAPPLNHLKH